MPSGPGSLFDLPLKIANHSSCSDIGAFRVSLISGDMQLMPRYTSCFVPCPSVCIASNFLRKWFEKVFSIYLDDFLRFLRRLLSHRSATLPCAFFDNMIIDGSSPADMSFSVV